MTRARAALALLAAAPALAVLPTHTQGSLDALLEGGPVHQAGSELALTADVKAYDVPIVDGYVVAELVRGGAVPPASAAAVEENVVHEEVFYGVNVKAGETARRRFAVDLPAGLVPGTYRLDLYLKTPRSPVSGVPAIFFTPRAAGVACQRYGLCSGFNVTGEGASAASLRFVRARTSVAGEVGQVGPVVAPGSRQPFSIALENDGAAELGNVSVLVGVYRWDDTEPLDPDPLRRAPPLAEQVVTFGDLRPGALRVVNGTLSVPREPTAYAVRLEARGGGRTYSLWRSRLDAAGVGGRIARVASSNHRIPPGEGGTVAVDVLPPADRRSDLVDARLRLEVTDDDRSALILNETAAVMAFRASGHSSHAFAVRTDALVSNWTIRATLLREGSVLDAASVHLDRAKFPPNVTAIALRALRGGQEARELAVGDTLELEAVLADELGEPGPGALDLAARLPGNRTVPLAEGRAVGPDGRFTGSVRLTREWLGEVEVSAHESERDLRSSAIVKVLEERQASQPTASPGGGGPPAPTGQALGTALMALALAGTLVLFLRLRRGLGRS